MAPIRPLIAVSGTVETNPRRISEGAESLNSTVKQLLVLVNGREQSAENQERYKKLMNQIHENLEKSTVLERKLWSNLTEKTSR